MRQHLLAIGLILTVAAGCDNVAWGGAEVQLRAPTTPEPTDTTPAGAAGGAAEGDSVVKVPGPILLAGQREGPRAELVLVGEILADGLHSFPDPRFPRDTVRLAELTEPGTEWVLFSEGVRVGRMVTDASEPAPEYCGSRVRVSGVVELVPTAADAVRLLAVPAADGDGQPYTPYEEHAHDYDQRVASLSIAGEAIRRYGATWPANGVLDIRAHIQAFQLADAASPWIAASFVNEDQLAVASPGQGAYALFVMGRPAGGEWVEAFTWFRSVEAEGKGAPRYHDHLDWDDDGADEILLDVFGANRRWFAALDRRDGAWARSYEDACASGVTTSN